MKPEARPGLTLMARHFPPGHYGWQKRETEDIIADESYFQDNWMADIH
jgi:hypothetical protein